MHEQYREGNRITRSYTFNEGLVILNTNKNKTESAFQCLLLLSLSCSPCPSILFWGNNQYNCRQFHASQAFGEGEMERDGEERVRGNVTLCPAKKSHPTTLLASKKTVTSRRTRMRKAWLGFRRLIVDIILLLGAFRLDKS